ncbi:hypothetical protein BBBOND_0103570 [Babesia bigemina]|uniref:6-Cys domain-containing protein n=1 Tax=Babesia bigemina TaxID=5866 RepID=A0A061D046_BABBI|nr:hypothetical protein BBBOND_0103570 [Babesia bigemina]CDR94043.1 hypothetical protein BBBOND_0103570 [Babesia bigemina]|eukprot:XP_012766229.1 hypothetical protein BBBOND_0103570 [Babesia bigemina]
MMWFSVLVGAALACVCAVENAFARTPHGRPPAPPLIFTGKSGSIKYEVTLDRVTLGQPHEANIVCGNDDGTPLGGEFTLYPSDPMTKTLLPLEGDDLEEAISKEVLLRNISRSTMLQIETSKHRGTGSFVKVKYPINALIMAKDPHNFSINYACKYQPHDKSQPPYYKWLEIKFKYVYPMAYGCESGNDMLFKNSVPYNGHINDVRISLCRLKPEPGMIFGIYCKPHEQVVPPNCFTDDQIAELDNAITPLLLPNLEVSDNPKYTVPARLKLFRISENGLNKDLKMTCQCKGFGGISAHLSLSYVVDEVVDSVSYMGDKSLDPKFKIHFQMHTMEPNHTYKILVPPEGWFKVGELGSVGTRLAPKHPDINTFNASPMGPNHATKLTDVVGSKGFQLTKKKNGKLREFTMNFPKDAPLVLKKEMPFIYYDWVLKRKSGRRPVDKNLRILYNIIPTDPFTYGCGVDSRDMFRKKGFELHQGKHEYETVCKINPYVLSPVGFYCPKHYTLEPAGCFGEMLHTESGRVVNLADYAPHANPINSANIRVLDFHVPKSMRRRVKYSNDELSCRCLDPDGRVHASITLDLRQPMTDENPPAVK